jgi:hypothetical protein
VKALFLKGLLCMPKTYDLLVLPPQTQPVYFVVEREDYPEYNQTDADRKFLYESHSCPTNWLQPVHMVHDGDSDPHGLIRYIGTKKEADLPPDAPWGPNERDAAFDAWIASTNGVMPDPLDS